MPESLALNRIDERIKSGDLPKIRDDEKQIIADLLAEVTPSLGKEEGAADKITDAVIRAYLHRPTREILKRVWKEYADGGDPAPFLDFADKLAAAAIPEALSLAVTFAQRAYFWHRHAGCRRASMPLTRQAYWTEKFVKTKARDQSYIERLMAIGWAVHIIWECEVRDRIGLRAKLQSILGRSD